MAKLGVTSGVLIIAILVALLGLTSSPTYQAIAWLIIVGGFVLVITNIIFKVGLHGDSEDKGVKYFFAIILVIILGFGISLTGMMPVTPKAASVTGTGTGASVTGTGTGASVTGTGSVLIGQFDFRPVDGTGATFATATSNVAFVDGTPTRYDFMKLLSDTGTSAVQFQGVSSRFYTVSSGSFQETQLQGHIGDKFSICGYKDTTPTAAENTSFCKGITLTGFNPQSGSNGGIWNWQFNDGSGIRYKWPSYANTFWYDGGDINRVSYLDYQASSLTGRSMTVYVKPNNTGESIINGGIYIETNSGNASNIKKVTIQNVQTGQSVTYTSLSNVALMSTSSPAYLAAPSLVTSTNTMYWVGKFPDDGYIRTSSSDLGKYAVTVLYDNPSNGNWIWYIQGEQNVDALSSAGGHFAFTQANGFMINATSSNSGTNGFI